jgi:probable F420-dependent oxidoreductase
VGAALHSAPVAALRRLGPGAPLPAIGICTDDNSSGEGGIPMVGTKARGMKFGLHFGMVNPGLWVQLATEADRLGFESVWLPEHLVVPMDASSSPTHGEDHPPIPSNIPVFDVFTMLGFIAARTERIRLGTNVYNIGLRHPFVTARAATTLDILSGGRVDLGIGASWLRQEWDAVGLDFDSRGARVDETIEICQRLWTEDIVEFHGRFHDFGPTAFEPKPVQKPGLPLQIGGDGAAAFRRVATVGAGWMPMNHTLEQLPESMGRIRALAEQAGRTSPIELTMTAEISSADDVAAYAAAGVTRLVVRPWTRTSNALAGIKTFSETVLPLFA